MITLDIARTETKESIQLLGKMANRHGLIAGATGTGKSITVRKMAEEFSQQGVPVFLVDVKGDFSGLGQKGESSGKVGERAKEYHLNESYFHSFPVRFWDIYAEKGIPLRVTISDMGPLLLARLLGLNGNQEGLLNLIFKVADDHNWLLHDLKDLRSLLNYVGSHADEYKLTYGNVSSASIGVIQRQLLSLEGEGGEIFFGDPALNFQDLIKIENDQGVINILNSERLMRSPKVFSAFLLWLLAQLFSHLPECGDLDKPKLILFFDEAHLLFDSASEALLNQIEQVVRLIRSKGVGVYFCTQNPLDLPESILGQLGNRVQHALRAFTPKDQKSVKAAAQTFRENLKIKVVDEITRLEVGQALVSFLDEKGMPHPVEKVYILPPSSQLKPLDGSVQLEVIQKDILFNTYHHSVDPYSAFEAILETENQKIDVQADKVTRTAKEKKAEVKEEPGVLTGFFRGVFGLTKHRNKGIGYDVSNELGKTVKNKIGKTITRGILGILSNKK